MQTEQDTERAAMIREAVAASFKAGESANFKQVKDRLPSDFFFDFDNNKPLDDVTAFREVQAAVIKPKEAEPEQVEEADFPEYLPPSERVSIEPVAEPIAEPAQIESAADHVEGGPGLSKQAELDAARAKEGNLLAERPSLQVAARYARDELQNAKIAYAEIDPRKQTPEQLSADYRKASQEQRAARARGERWATPPERRPGGQVAFVDLERAYGQGGDADTFVRRTNRTGNRRGAYPKQALGGTNFDKSRGAVPKPVEASKPTIPQLAK